MSAPPPDPNSQWEQKARLLVPGWGVLGPSAAVGVGQEVILQLRGQRGGVSGCQGVSLQPLPSQSSLSCFQTHRQQWGRANKGHKKAERLGVGVPGGGGWAGHEGGAEGPVGTSPECVFSQSVDALGPRQAQGQG